MDESDAAETGVVGSVSELNDGIGGIDDCFVVTSLESSTFSGIHSVLEGAGWAELGMESGLLHFETESKVAGALSVVVGEVSADLRQNE